MYLYHKVIMLIILEYNKNNKKICIINDANNKENNENKKILWIPQRRN